MLLLALSAGVGDHSGVQGAADAAFERPESLFAGLALGDFLVVIGAAVAVAVAHLGDGRHVQGVVQLAAAPHRQAVALLLARGGLYGRRAVVGSEVVLVGQAADVGGEPTVMAATTGPTPKILVVVVREATTTASGAS